MCTITSTTELLWVLIFIKPQNIIESSYYTLVSLCNTGREDLPYFHGNAENI